MKGFTKRLNNWRLAGLLVASALLWCGCAATGSGYQSSYATAYPTTPPQQITAQFRSIALLPVQFVGNQPDGLCHPYIGDDLRSTLARDLRSRGYEVHTVPDRSPLSFALDPPAPEPMVVPGLLQLAPAGVDAAISLWVDEYVAITLCEPKNGKYLSMGVVMVLYELPEQRELGRWYAKEWISGMGSSRDTVWAVTMRLSRSLLQGIP